MNNCQNLLNRIFKDLDRENLKHAVHKVMIDGDVNKIASSLISSDHYSANNSLGMGHNISNAKHVLLSIDRIKNILQLIEGKLPIDCICDSTKNQPQDHLIACPKSNHKLSKND